MFTISALNHDKMYARIASLEHTITELKNTNEAIIQRVSDKTSDSIGDLESIIKQTGLNPDSLKKQVSQNKSAETGTGEGGPYISADPTVTSPEENELYNSLDQLSALRHIVGNLPLTRPIKNAEERSTFGRRIDPLNGHLAFHSGLDLAGPIGSRIYSTANGKVSAAGFSGAYGNCIDIDHGYGISTRYGHLSVILVKEGQLVKKGDVIGIQGSTGRSTGPHVHYEVRYKEQAMNPENFLNVGNHVSN
jgi:murein DD-endopeptidase MepM/ murein hydrolase activator NlpD